MNMNENVAFVDVETMGLDPVRHPIWEIAVIVDDVEHLWQVVLHSLQMEMADPEALKINGFEDRYGTDVRVPLVPPNMSAAKFAKLVAGRHLVGANVRFDEERLRLMHDAHLDVGEGERYPWHYHLIDVEAMALGYLHGAAFDHQYDTLSRLAEMPPYRAADLGALLGVPETPEDERHTAIGDVRWVKRMWHAMTDYVLDAP
jgi:DNA polymerase III epsilon subunit-like protein